MSNIGAGGGLSTTPDMVGNKAPVVTLEGSKSRAARAGEPVAFTAVATDDGKPNRKNMPATIGGDYSSRLQLETLRNWRPELRIGHHAN